MKKDTAAEIINRLMKPGHPVRQADVLAAGLPAGWSRQISRASLDAADGTAALLSAHDLADRLLSAGKDRAALALREAIRGTPPSTRQPPASEQDPAERTARITRRLPGIDGVSIDEFLKGDR